MELISVDLKKQKGRIKPLHGVNNGPKTSNFWFDTADTFRRAAIPFVRLHDTEYPYGSGHFVDIHCVFPDFGADPYNPDSYDFWATDEYIKAIVESGAKPFYRLGESIEHPAKKYHIFPPKDNLRWAVICEGIIRHYTEGWADGFYYDMQYWEIWNEPDNAKNPEKSPMWQGTKEEFFRLYESAANHLKNRFPHLKIGGYASCGFYALSPKSSGETFISENSDEGSVYFIEFFHDFMKYITDPVHLAPLDFFSWHEYTADPESIVFHADYVRKQLDCYGLNKTESIFGEWNYSGNDMFAQMKRMPGAAFCAAVLCGLQFAPVDSAMYYGGAPTLLYNGLYENLSVETTKTYLVFETFGKLYQFKTEVFARCEKNGIYTCAAKNDTNDFGVMAVNYDVGETELTLKIEGSEGPENTSAKVFLLDDRHDMEEIQTFRLEDEYKFVLSKNSVVFIENSG
ncbi:MAG: hypothetical protein FWD23_01965 [Oscillospiraceae bacterium]|nr:hypothetical protein [Oscillospiraceae bacterium]